MTDTIRKLATIQIIDNVAPIPKADQIEVVTVLGWSIVSRKGEFSKGDKCILFEIDCILPKTKWSEFLIDKNHPDRPIRLRTKKLRGQLSQGLALTPASIGVDGSVGDDLTEKLGIRKYDTQIADEQTLTIKQPKSKVLKYLMSYSVFRYCYLKLNSKEKGDYPIGVSHTDEENLQRCSEIISNNFDKSFYITEKCEGSSFTAFSNFERKWGFKRKVFGVCSRNIWIKTPNDSKYWQMFKKYNFEKIFKSYKCPITIQAEMIGIGIQGNIYKLDDIQLRVFNFIVDGKRLNYTDMTEQCKKHNLPVVPLIDNNFIPCNHIPINDKDAIVKWGLDYSNGVSQLYNTKKEGIVCRLNDNPVVSFKVRSPNYLIEHEE